MRNSRRSCTGGSAVVGVSECMGSAGDVYTTAESSTASSVFAFDSATTPSENVVLLEGAVEPCRAVGRKRRE